MAIARGRGRFTRLVALIAICVATLGVAAGAQTLPAIYKIKGVVSDGLGRADLCLGQCRAAASTQFERYAIFTRDEYYIPVMNGTTQGNPHSIRVAALTWFFNHGYHVATAYPDEPRSCLTPGNQVTLCKQHVRESYSDFPNPSVQVPAQVYSSDPDIYMNGTSIACHVLLPNDSYPERCGSDDD